MCLLFSIINPTFFQYLFSLFFPIPFLIIVFFQSILFVTFRDRVRTVVNVLGDCLGAGIVNHISQNDLIAPASIEPTQNPANTSVNYEIETQKEI